MRCIVERLIADEHNRLGHQGDARVQGMLVDGMPEQPDLRLAGVERTVEAREERRPVVLVPSRQQAVIGQPDDRTGLIEMGQRALAAGALLGADLGDVLALARRSRPP